MATSLFKIITALLLTLTLTTQAQVSIAYALNSGAERLPAGSSDEGEG